MRLPTYCAASLAVACWVGSVEQVGAQSQPGTTYHVATTGNDADPGTKDRPWRTIAHALRVLVAGDTLHVHPGTYFERGLTAANAGSADAPITITGKSDRVPVIDGGFAEFRAAGNSDWEIVEDARNIYRSTAAFRGADRVYGFLGSQDGGYELVPYETYAALTASSEEYSETQPFYAGPGVFWNPADARIYVRLDHGRYQAQLGTNVPANLDPRFTPMVLFPRSTLLNLAPPASYLVFEGLALRHTEIVVDVARGCHHITWRRCEVLGGRYGVVTRGDAHDLLFDEIDVRGQFPPWVARSDVKRPSAAPPAHLLQGSALQLEGRLDAVEVRNSTFTGLFDAIDTNAVPTHMHIHHNRFTTIRDDAFELACGGHDVEFDHNTVLVAAAAVSWAGPTSPPLALAGTKYIHHNVIDTSTPQLYGRDDPASLLPPAWRGPHNDGMATGRPFNTHDVAGLRLPDPWKIYHNTIVGGADVDGEGLGITYILGPSNSQSPHELFNNILVQTADQYLAHGARVADGSQVIDGNLYFRSFAAPTQPLLKDYRNGGAAADFARLLDFTTSPYFQATRTYYAPGWEASGVEGDPGLDANYRPLQTGPAASGAIDLSSRGWPGTTPLGYRGALPPR